MQSDKHQEFCLQIKAINIFKGNENPDVVSITFHNNLSSKAALDLDFCAKKNRNRIVRNLLTFYSYCSQKATIL